MAKTLIGVGGGAIGGGAGALLKGRQEKRGMENSALMSQFEDQAFDPNRAREDAVTRNFRGNLLQNLQGADPAAVLGGRSAEGNNNVPLLYQKMMQSLTGGMHEDLVGGYGDLSTVQGLDLGEGRIQNEFKQPELKGPGFMDALLGGIAGAGNAASSL